MGQGRKRECSCDICYSGQEGTFGVGFVAGERLRRRVQVFTSVDERLDRISLKAKFSNI